MLEEDEKAFSYFEEALKRWDKLSIFDRKAMTFSNLGDLCKKKGDFAKAISYHEQAMALYRQLKDLPAVQATEQELEALRASKEEHAKEVSTKIGSD
jgi:tetratricopeptide (TPR) repeat protein